MAVSPDCYTNGFFDVKGWGTKDRMVDYVFGGAGATSGPSLDPVNGNLGSDILDRRPRGSYVPGDETDGDDTGHRQQTTSPQLGYAGFGSPVTRPKQPP